MKKAVKWLSLTAIVVCMCLACFACGNESVKGTYVGSREQTMEGTTVSMEITLELKDDDAFTITAKMTAGEYSRNMSMEGTYKVEGEKISLTIIEEGTEPTPDDTLVGTIKKGKITVDMDEELGGGTFTLTKK